MVNLTGSFYLIGGLVLILGIVLGVRSFLESRRKKATAFRNYFCTEFDPDIFHYISSGEDENAQSDRRSQFVPFRLPHLDRGLSADNATQWDRE